jgi:catechol-2,3-dioxygenase
MTILGVQTVVYGVEDLTQCRRFFDDFGLISVSSGIDFEEYQLPEGSRVILRHSTDPTLPPAFADGPGVRRVIWGVDSQQSLDSLEADLQHDRPVEKDANGRIYFQDDAGLPIGLDLFERKPLYSDEELINSPGRALRWNRHRKWFRLATPRLVHHVVFGCPDYEKAARFYRDRLKFRVTDVARDRGIFLRADGRSDHHNLFWLKDKRSRFLHISFGVENLDELLAGANHMQRGGWSSNLGLGRHRISSTIYFYYTNPAGGEAEYSADTDCLDDNWQPRVWGPMYGNQHWIADLPPFLLQLPEEDMTLLSDVDPNLASIPK